jgi:ribosome biogenesis SPOUT family RNA methylase Rps3
MANSQLSFVVEHLDPELGPWSALEYKTIAQESHDAGCAFILSSVPESLLSSGELRGISHAQVQNRGVEAIFADKKSKVCLLDPAAKQELSPEDANVFEVYLFGGILGQRPFYCIWGTLLTCTKGDDPPRGKKKNDMKCPRLISPDRTSELRQKGYAGRRLGPKQMTTDTAVRVTRMVVQDKSL